MNKPVYESPLCSRYASGRMQYIFSPDFKFLTWHRLWLVLAENEMKLGLGVTAEQVGELRENLEVIDYEAAERYERELRHDVMAHIGTRDLVCPKARGIIHLGATSCYVDDNGDLIAYREALKQIRMLLVNALAALADFIEKNADTPVLAYTHYQAAQPTTVGKRAAMWAQDLAFDLERLDFELERIPFYGCKGATGTGASFLALFGGDAEKAMQLERNIAHDMGFEAVLPICGQTYTRKLDYYFLSVLSGIAQSAGKMATDLRLMAHEKEFDEPFTQLPGRLERHGLQAQPHAQREDMLPRALRPRRRHQPRDNGLDPVAGAHAGRQRQPPHLHTRGLPRRGRHTQPRHQHHLRLYGLSGHHGAASPRGAALPRH